MQKRSAFASYAVCAILTTLAIVPNESHAFKTVTMTPLEWNSLPEHCRVENKRVFKAPPGAHHYKMNSAELDLRWKIGLWHYCTGLVKLMRAETGTELMTPARAEDILGNIAYSFSRIDSSHPWSVEMRIAVARVRRLEGKQDEALKILDELRKEHPDYPQIYITYTAVLFRDKRYEDALPMLAEGNKATGDRHPNIHYFLGLAYFRTGDINNARLYEEKARKAGYPFDYLTRKLAEYDSGRR